MQIIACSDGSLVVAPVSPENVTAIAAEMGIHNADDPLTYDGRFVLIIPSSRAMIGRKAVEKMAKKDK